MQVIQLDISILLPLALLPLFLCLRLTQQLCFQLNNFIFETILLILEGLSSSLLEGTEMADNVSLGLQRRRIRLVPKTESGILNTLNIPFKLQNNGFVFLANLTGNVTIFNNLLMRFYLGV